MVLPVADPKRLTKLAQSDNLSLDCIILETTYSNTEVNGIDVAKEIRDFGYNNEIILMSKWPEFIPESFVIRPLAFIEKPLKYDRVERHLSQVFCHKSKPSTIMLQDSLKRTHYLNVKDIIYVEVSDHILTYHLSYKSVSCRTTLKESLHLLTDLGFQQINKHCAVSLAHAITINEQSKEVMLNVNRKRKRLHISRHYYPDFMLRYTDYKSQNRTEL